MCFVRMINVSENTFQLHAPYTDEPNSRAAVLEPDNQWDALAHNLMGLSDEIKTH